MGEYMAAYVCRYGKRYVCCFAILGAFFATLLMPTEVQAAPDAKVTICHVPPGNPNNKATLVVDSSAVKAHLAHGDTQGACPAKQVLVDTDGDGVTDNLDGCKTDPFKTAAGGCGCGISDTDSDGDLTPDCNDSCPNDP